MFSALTNKQTAIQHRTVFEKEIHTYGCKYSFYQSYPKVVEVSVYSLPDMTRVLYFQPVPIFSLD